MAEYYKRDDVKCPYCGDLYLPEITETDTVYCRSCYRTFRIEYVEKFTVTKTSEEAKYSCGENVKVEITNITIKDPIDFDMHEMMIAYFKTLSKEKIIKDLKEFGFEVREVATEEEAGFEQKEPVLRCSECGCDEDVSEETHRCSNCDSVYLFGEGSDD